MIKAMKKLKIWSKRKKKKKTPILHQPPPPPPPPLHTNRTGHCCCSCSATQPSAPPLPQWIEFEQTQETVSVYGSFPAFSLDPPPPPISDPDEFSSSSSLQRASSSEITPLLYSAPLPDTVNNQSYQQYMVPTPVYHIPPVIMAPTQTKRYAAGVLGCVVGVGSHLIHCLCPCSQFHKSYS